MTRLLRHHLKFRVLLSGMMLQGLLQQQQQQQRLCLMLCCQVGLSNEQHMESLPFLAFH